MKKITVFVIFNVIFSWMCFSQQTLLRIDTNNISNTEFKRVYLKNSNNEVATQKDIDDYLNLFINFKLKKSKILQKIEENFCKFFKTSCSTSIKQQQALQALLKYWMPIIQAQVLQLVFRIRSVWLHKL